MVLKLLLVLRNYTLKRATQAVLGEDVYKRIFQQTDRAVNPTPQSSNNINRYLNGEVVGRPLEAWNPHRAEVDANICQHPASAMKARGNRDQKWWTCVLCQSRWERLPFNRPGGPPADSEQATFGRHAGQTFKTIYEQHQDYTAWILRTVESGDSCSEDLKRLAEYIVRREAREAMEPQPEDEQMPDRR